MKKNLMKTLTLLLAVGMAASVADAGKGGGKGKPGSSTGGGTLALVMYTDINGNGLPNWGDTVTFNISTTATTKPVVQLGCYQGGVVVASGTGDFYADSAWSWTRLMTLNSVTWKSGAADCTATLGYTNLSNGSFVNLASINFHVDE